jgi:ABC-type multidrug transport system fused ATPase/permease subunit
MDKGKIVEQGTHSDLITDKDGFYKKLYDAQLKKEGSFIAD